MNTLKELDEFLELMAAYQRDLRHPPARRYESLPRRERWHRDRSSAPDEDAESDSVN